MIELIKSLDLLIFHFINHTLSNEYLNYPMALLTEMGSIYFALGIGFILLLSRGRQLKLTGFVLMASVLIMRIIYIPVKGMISRPRPFEYLPGVHLPCGEGMGFSFPSGHTTVAFITAVILSARFPRWRKMFYLAAFVVAFSRVYIGVHYPSDVIGGAIIGTTFGLIMVALGRRVLDEWAS